MFDFSIVTQWFDGLLRNTLGLGDFLSILIECVLVGAGILVGYALIAIVLLGPMRVGPWGLLQVFADVLKMLIKEIFFVDRADKFLYAVAPLLVIIGSVGAFSFGPRLQCGCVPAYCYFFDWRGGYFPRRLGLK